MVNGSSILVFVLIQKRFVGEVVHCLQAEQGVVEVVVVGFDILQGGDALTGREFVPDFACLAGIYLVLAGNLVVLFPESFEAIVGRCAGCRFLFGRTGYPDIIIGDADMRGKSVVQMHQPLAGEHPFEEAHGAPAAPAKDFGPLQIAEQAFATCTYILHPVAAVNALLVIGVEQHTQKGFLFSGSFRALAYNIMD